MKKHRQIIMFIFMLAMMVMMANLATRNLERPALVEVLSPGEENWLLARDEGRLLVFTEEVHGVPLFYFAIRNISDEQLLYTKRYELWKISGDYLENMLFATIESTEDYLLLANETVIFVYGGQGGMPMDFDIDLEPGRYVMAKIFMFRGLESGISHGINIAGREFTVY